MGIVLLVLTLTGESDVNKGDVDSKDVQQTVESLPKVSSLNVVF
ncbi:hypothetical protein RBH29_03785 [Herbivorax sp. ANBcel31]|nr:hypothetical protein [Herbivorax sp. ANBcel31]MDQ2085553.1 hypothetical protein [Herbivorax sp. ANBcel31]